MTLVLREVGGISVRAAHRGRTLVNWRVTGGAHFELGEFVIRNINRITRIPVTSSNTLSRLDDFSTFVPELIEIIPERQFSDPG
jgi:hypothetical protein